MGNFNKENISLQVFNPRVITIIRNYLKSVVNGKNGTGRSAQIQGYDIAGKTGTSRRLVQGKYSTISHHSTFIGMLPVTTGRDLVIGVFFQDIQSGIDYHVYESRCFQYMISGIIFGFLILVWVFGTEEFGASQRLRVFDRTIQPTEYAKIMVVLVLSYTITLSFRKNMADYFLLSFHSLIIGILIIMIAMQPDYGAVLILIFVSLTMLVVARIHARQSVFLVSLFGVIGGAVFLLLCEAFKDWHYVVRRFAIFVKCFFVSGCNEYQMFSAYHTIQSGNFAGITLPFVSHGGNSLLSSMIAIGILLNISKNTIHI